MMVLVVLVVVAVALVLVAAADCSDSRSGRQSCNRGSRKGGNAVLQEAGSFSHPT